MSKWSGWRGLAPLLQVFTEEASRFAVLPQLELYSLIHRKERELRQSLLVARHKASPLLSPRELRRKKYSKEGLEAAYHLGVLSSSCSAYPTD